MAITYTAVEFEIGIGQGLARVRVPFADAQRFHDEQFNPAGAWVKGIFWLDPQTGEEHWTCAKSWIYGKTQRISRIGSGAYGDDVVVLFEPVDTPSATLAEYQRQSQARRGENNSARVQNFVDTRCES